MGKKENFSENFQNIRSLIEREKIGCDKLISVFSAFSGVTRELSNKAIYTDHSYPGNKLFDFITSRGEDEAVDFLYKEFSKISDFKNDLGAFSRENIPIITDSVFGNANIIQVNSKKIMEMFKYVDTIFFPGFIGRNPSDLITTLGSNGSDTTSIALASALRAECVISKDSGAVLTADPRIIPDAMIIDVLNLSQANTLASLGSEVIHSKGAAYAELAKQDIIIRSIDGQTETKISSSAPVLKFAGVTWQRTAKGIRVSVVGDNIGSRTAYDILKDDCEHSSTPYGDEASSVLFAPDDEKKAKEAMAILHTSLIGA